MLWDLRNFLLLIFIYKISALLNRDNEIEEKNEINKKSYEQSKISAEQGKMIKLLEHLEYYQLIPQQTEYDGIDDLVTSKVISTSPPRLTIQPSSIDKSHLSTVSFSTRSASPLNAASYQCQSFSDSSCVSETGPFDTFSSHILQSSILKQTDVSVMAGREEVPSKTESLNGRHSSATILAQPSTKLVLKT